jgi:hypothetical protein
MNQKLITQKTFDNRDFLTARLIAARLGRNDNNCVYTSTSNLIGLQYLKRNNEDKQFFIIKTVELGFMVVSDLEDINCSDLAPK